MQCWRCRCENNRANAFCEDCGAPVGLACVACGHVNGATSRFCGKCRHPLTSEGSSAEAADQVLRALSASGGERKYVTVLFADIRNSTGLIAEADPEHAMRLLQPALDAMKDAVHRYDGTVNKMQGDGIMALFGAARPQEDHSVRGCLAALSMQEAVARFGDPDPRIRVGLHTGEVVVQTVRNSLYDTLDAAGAAVHLASRMEQMSDEGGILLTAATLAGAKQFVRVRPRGPQMVRGFPAPVEVFELVGLRHAPASEVFRAGKRLSPLTGRSEQLAVLEAELANTASGDGCVVGVVGEAGIGKSRLCFEFTDNCRRKGIRVLEARVLAHGKATPFQPVLELLRDFFGIRAKEGADVSRRRVAERMTQLPGSQGLLPLVLEFLGLADPARPAARIDPKARKQRLLEFIRLLPRSGPRNVVVVVLVEDLHWIDTASQEFVEALADGVAGTPTLLLLNFRPGFAAPLMQRSHYRQLGMPPLAATQAQALLHDVLGDDPSLALLGRNIVERAQGNPFFLEELVNSLVERGDFEGERGAYRLKGRIDAIPLPTTVQAVVAARIDRLEEVAKRALQTASVVGREVPISILEHVTGVPQAELSEAIWQLRRAELLYDLPPYDQGLIAFRHPLIQEVAYRSVLQVRRRELHAAVARATETLFKDRPEERAGLLAYHLEQAGDTFKAAQQNMRAAVWVGANDPGQALRSWKKVRELLLHQPSSPPTDYLRMMACGQIMNFGWREGISADDAEVYFEEAKQLAVAAGDMRANALIHAAYGRILAASGSADDYVERVREAAALADATADASLQVTLKAVLCHALRLSGRMTEALQMNIEASDHAGEIGRFDHQMLGFDVEIWLAAMRGQTLVMLGRGAEARAFLDRVLHMEDNQVDPTHHVVPSLAYVDLAWALGDPVMAQTHADRAFSLAMKSGSPYLRVYAQACRGLSHMIARRLSAAIEDLCGALEFARRRKAGLENEPRILVDLAEAYRLNGDIRDALITVDEAMRIATLRHARAPLCQACIVRARALLASGSREGRAAARDELARAETLLQETGAIIYEAGFRSVEASDTPTPGHQGRLNELSELAARTGPARGGQHEASTQPRLASARAIRSRLSGGLRPVSSGPLFD